MYSLFISKILINLSQDASHANAMTSFAVSRCCYSAPPGSGAARDFSAKSSFPALSLKMGSLSCPSLALK